MIVTAPADAKTPTSPQLLDVEAACHRRRVPSASTFALSLALLVGSAPPLVLSPGFPSFDAQWEKVLYGSPGADPGAVAMRGRFVDEGGGLRLVEGAPFGESMWLASTVFTDGVVRARFLAGERLDASLLVRITLAPNGEIEEGYAVNVDKNVLKILRFEHGVPRLVGPEVKLDAPAARGSVLELVVTMTGPLIGAAVYDGATLVTRARVDAHDRRAATGRVGVRAARIQDADSAVTLLTVGSAGTPHALVDDGAGAERVLVLAAGQLPLLPADLRAKAFFDEQRGWRLVTDPVGEERVLRAGIEPLSRKTQVPFMDLDATMRAHMGKPPTSTPTGLRVDESYKDADMVEALVRAYAARFPKIARVEEIGRTLEGRAITALHVSDRPDAADDEDAVLLDGAHHGGELMSTEQVLDAAQQLLERYHKDPQITAFVDELSIWIVPLVNADGNMRYVHDTRDYDRKNARDIDDNHQLDGWDGVDLYRNYPVRFGGLGEVGSRTNPFHYRYRGPSAGSEPEVQAMMKLAERERFTASIDFHTNATAILVPYTDPGMTNPVENEAWTVAEEIAKPLPVQPNGRRYSVQRNLYPVDGTCQDWLRFTFGTVALLVEGPLHNPEPYGKARTAAVVGGRGTWTGLFQRVLDGPGIVLHAKDAAGNPIEAEVVIDELKQKMGEVWTTRPRDGRTHRLVPAAGAYTVRVRPKGGGAEVVRHVDVGADNAHIDVTLR